VDVERFKTPQKWKQKKPRTKKMIIGKVKEKAKQKMMYYFFKGILFNWPSTLYLNFLQSIKGIEKDIENKNLKSLNHRSYPTSSW